MTEMNWIEGATKNSQGFAYGLKTPSQPPPYQGEEQSPLLWQGEG